MSTLEQLAKEAAACTRCDLYQQATATGQRAAVAMDAIAGEVIFGCGFKVRDHRGHLAEVKVGRWHGPVLSTVHPSSILRAADSEAREQALAGFLADLVKAREALAASRLG